jgi:hypothetical protein
LLGQSANVKAVSKLENGVCMNVGYRSIAETAMNIGWYLMSYYNQKKLIRPMMDYRL